MSRSEMREFGFAVLRVFCFAATPLVVAAVGADLADDGLLNSIFSVEVLEALGLAAAAAGVRAVWGAFRKGQLPFPRKGVA